MTSKKQLELIDKLISTMDSFQQDYGQLRYSFTMSSYANRHLIVVHIFHNNDKMDFVIDETNEEFLYPLFEQKSKFMLGIKE